LERAEAQLIMCRTAKHFQYADGVNHSDCAPPELVVVRRTVLQME
jgi:hypothetical protein